LEEIEVGKTEFESARDFLAEIKIECRAQNRI